MGFWKRLNEIFAPTASAPMFFTPEERAKFGKTKRGAYRWWVYYYDPRPGVRKVMKSGPYATREDALADAADRRRVGDKKVRVTRTKRGA